jgi:hypothetical protein
VPTMSEGGSVPPVGYDGRNAVIFRTDNWTMSGDPNGRMYDTFALALTSVVARPDGRIVDADMEINAVPGISPNWANLDPGVDASTLGSGGQSRSDLQNAITHEFGHFIGLDHTCVRAAVDPWPVDDQGQMVPLCSDASPEIAQTVMFAETQPGETTKRVLSPDDNRAVCEIYAARLDPQTCSLDVPYEGCRGGCQSGGSGAGGAAAATLVGAALLIWTRRPRRARRRARSERG